MLQRADAFTFVVVFVASSGDSRKDVQTQFIYKPNELDEQQITSLGRIEFPIRTYRRPESKNLINIHDLIKFSFIPQVKRRWPM